MAITKAATLTLSPGRRIALDWAALAPMLLFACAFVLRAPHFNDPAYDLDEAFYLVVGDRLLHGALPYVDLWDRKPIGLFLLYGAIRLLGGGGIWQYQIVATLFAGGTAWTIARLARPSAGTFGSVAAGLAYLCWIETIEGGGGQAPVFYNLLVALAAHQMMTAGAETEPARFRRHGRWAMLLAGLAIQIKYTVACEALYFGLVLAWWSARRRSPAEALRDTTVFAAIALAPTVAAAAAYVAIGQGPAFVHANFLSIFARAPSDAAEVHMRLVKIALQFLPFAVCLLASLWEQRHDDPPAQRRRQLFVLGWIAAALAGFASVGAFYFHYALPLVVPLAVAAAPIFRRAALGPALAACLLWLPLSHLDYPDLATAAGHRRAVERLLALIPADVDRRCLQLFEGPPILYLRSGACLASRFPFPDHLIAAKEARSLGVDRSEVIETLFAKRPGAIVMGAESFAPDRWLDRLIRRHLAETYHLAGGATLDGREIDVFVPR